jgi:hypothetical protein
LAHALEQIEPDALDLIEASTECRLALACAALEATEPASAPPAGRAPLRMSLTIREAALRGCVPTDRQIAARKRRQHHG